MSKDNEKDNALLDLGKRVGRHQAFDLIAKRCTAADAETLKSIRDNAEYKRLGLTWKQFCEQELGVSRVYADQQIHCIEKYGAAYYRVAEIVPLSSETYELISSAVTDGCIEVDGDRVPLTRENRRQVAAAVKKLRERSDPEGDSSAEIGALRKHIKQLLDDAYRAARLTDKRMELMKLLTECCGQLDKLTEELRLRTLIVG
jgi:hypothetical protein